MKTRVMMLSLFTMVLVGAGGAGVLGTTFTYQGVLSDGGSPVTGDVDLRFSLWDAPSGGSQVGSPIVIEDVAVSDGRVTVPLDFGDVFGTDELWLVVEVRDGASSGAFTVLTPRQALTAAPFAAHAIEAETAGSAMTAGHATTADSATTAVTATTAGDSDTLDGQHGGYYLAWSNLSGKPGGLDDGDDDTLANLSCSSGEVAAWDGSSWACASAGGSAFSRTIVVGPVGDAAANGAFLVATLSGLPVPAGPADSVQVLLEPGEYDLGGANFMLWNWVHLRGAGRLATRIFSEACGPVNRVVSLGDGELSDLTVENTCSTPSATAQGVSMGSIGLGARISRVNIVLSGTTNYAYGIYSGMDNLFIEDVQVNVSGAVSASGIELYGTNVFIIDSIVYATGSNSGIGLELQEGASVVTSRGNFTGIGSAISIGLNARGASIDASDANFEGDNAAIKMYGTDGEQSGNFSGIGAHGQVHVNGDSVDDMIVRIHQSRVSDFTNSIVLIPGTGSVRVTGSELDGGPVIGSVQCVAVWDEGSTFYPNTCP